MDLHYEDTGSGGDVLVLMHGGTMDLRMWDDQMPALSARHRVIRYDARGHGRSPTATEPYRQCDDAAALLRHLGVGRATLIGLSMGGSAAIDTTLEHPELVERLVVMGSGTNEPEFDDPWMLQRFANMATLQESRDVDGWVTEFLLMGLVGPYREPSEVDARVTARCRQMATDTVRHHARPGAVTPHGVTGSWPRLGEIRIPALALYGTLDAPDHVAMVERVAAGIDGCRLVPIEGAAHMPNMERPDLVGAQLRGFLDQ
ncbi:alpha/beta fold hydrolase [Actinoplanes sp. NPDC024001]|uniref:alpha/beta fold hydrolase n=1 Tax=Actinoplanes sp. NPDC024001 TaxID=3154598 RepID=UPI0033E074A5